MTGVPQIHPSIVGRHAEDAAFLWLLRERAVRGMRHSHQQMLRLDDRVDAHLDGLRLAGEYGWRLCRDELREWMEPGEAFAASWLAYGRDPRCRASAVLDLVLGAPELEDALVEASRWHPLEAVRRLLGAWLQQREPALRRLGLLGLAAHRHDLGDALLPALGSHDHRLVGAAIAAAADLGRTDLVGALGEHLCSHRREAACALARLGCDDDEVGAVLASSHDATSIGWLMRLDPGAGLESFARWAARAGDRPLAIEAATVLGDPRTVPVLLQWMRDENLAQAAGQAFSTIVGVDLEEHSLEHAPQAERADEVPWEPRHDLPWPSAFAAAHWWRAQSHRFRPGSRYLEGVSIGDEEPNAYSNLRALAGRGRPRARRLAALELARRHPARVTLATRAPKGRGHARPGDQAWPAVGRSVAAHRDIA